MDRSVVIEAALAALAVGDKALAAHEIETGYPFEPVTPTARRYDERLATRVFVRDGFLDRYRGGRLYFPAVLRLLSRELPGVFPFHPNWKMDACHTAYWECQATIDHLTPAAHGGADDETNFVAVSMKTNAIKSSWTLEDLGWSFLPAGDITEWDGGLGWFMDYAEAHPEILADTYIARWHRAALAALAEA